MIITLEKIKELKPCISGLNDFITKYPEFKKDTLENILMLENISYDNKIWLAGEVLDKITLVQWSVDCAEMVKDNFNKEFPNDNRVRECIETIKKYILKEVDSSAAESAAESTWPTAGPAAQSARLAAQSARSAAWSARSAARSAAAAAARSAARSAAGSAAWSAARAAWSAEKDQENINLSLLIALVTEDV